MCCRNGFKGNNLGVCIDYCHANLVCLPQKYAFEFLVFCQRNPKAFPLLEVTDKGLYSPNIVFNQEIDLRTDLAQYRVYEYGDPRHEEIYEVTKYWRDDLVSYIFGCSHTFDYLLGMNGVEQRRLNENKYAALYLTNIQCRPSGSF